LQCRLTVVPGWIAFGPGTRACTSSIGALASEWPCRIRFGVGAVLLALMFIVTVRQALAARKAS